MTKKVSARGRLAKRRVTSKRWQSERRSLRKDPAKSDDLVWGPPVAKENEIGKFVQWTTLCGRYRISKPEGTYDSPFGFVTEMKEYHKHKTYVNGHKAAKKLVSETWCFLYLEKGGYYPKRFKALETAMEFVLNYHRQVKPTAQANTDSALSRSKEILGDMIRRDTVVPRTETGEEKTVKPRVTTGKVERDRFGQKVGSQAADFNKVLSREPKTMNQLQKEAGWDRSPAAHLNKLVGLGFLEVSGSGRDRKYSLK